MIMADNKQNKNPNVPNLSFKREQSETCFDSAERVINQKQNVPNLRFPEFTEDWVQYKCSDLLEFYSTNSLSWEQLDYDNNDLLNLHYGLIHVGLPTLVNVEQHNLPSVKPEFKPKNYTLCKSGDIAFADASEDTNEVAKPIEFYDCSDKQVVCGLHTIHGRDKLNATEIGFKGYAFSSMPFHHNIRRLAQGSKIYSISSKNFSEVTIGIPQKEEQRKIVDLLSKLEERITTQNKIIQQLQSLIKGIYDKVFENISDYQKLSSVCTIQKGQQVNGEELSELGDYYVMNGGIEPSGYYDKYNTMPNTISISEGGNSCGYVQFNTVPFWSGGHCYTLQNIKEGYSNLFLYHYLKAKEKEIMALRIGSGLPNIQKKDLEKFIVPILPLETQVGIVDGINKIETKLKQEKDILSAYQKQKAYLLRNLFI